MNINYSLTLQYQEPIKIKKLLEEYNSNITENQITFYNTGNILKIKKDINSLLELLLLLKNLQDL